MKEHLNPRELYSGPGFSQVVAASGGKTVYVSGQIALDAEFEPVGVADLGQQADRVLWNLEQAVGAAGGDRGDLVTMRISVVDLDQAKAKVILEALLRFFGERPPPAVTMLGTVALAVPGLELEIEAIAVVD